MLSSAVPGRGPGDLAPQRGLGMLRQACQANYLHHPAAGPAWCSHQGPVLSQEPQAAGVVGTDAILLHEESFLLPRVGPWEPQERLGPLEPRHPRAQV